MEEIDLTQEPNIIQPLEVAQPAELSSVVPAVENMTDPVTGQPIVIAPATTTMIPVKRGSASETVTSQERSPQTRQAEQEYQQAGEEQKKAVDEEKAALDRQTEAEAKKQEQNNLAVRQVETARAKAQLRSQAKLQNDLADIDTRVAEFANYKPENFWDNKSTSDRVSAAIAIGLGSFGQALTGSGQNIGQVLLQRQMDEFDRNQERKYQAKLKQIDNMRTSLTTKMQLAEDAEKTYDAVKLAKLAQIDAQYGRGIAMAKTASTKAALTQKQAQISAQLAQIRIQQAAKYEKNHTQSVEKDTIEMMKLEPGMGPDGKPKQLTEGQARARLSYSDIVTANQTLNNVDLVAVNNTSEFQSYMSNTRSRKAMESVPVLGKFIKGLAESTTGNPEQELASTRPDLLQAVSAMDAWTQAITRFKTGAVIGPDEVEQERKVYFPVLGDTDKVVQDKAKRRHELEQAMRQAAALENP